ncbi:MAG: HEAT repeat domain-containing protein [Nitrospirales bacterium]|nr:HEAT repeat domain-containing protein [Nitrospirales bacterium]
MISSICRRCAGIFLLLLIAVLGGINIRTAGAEPPEVLQGELRVPPERLQLEAVEKPARSGDIGAVKTVIAILNNRDEDWKIRIRAMRLLGDIGDPRAEDALMSALRELCPALKWNAAAALGRFSKSPRVVNALIDALGDPDLYVREMAVQALGNIGDRKAVPFILSALAEKSFAVRISAIRALGRLGDPVALPSLQRAAEGDPDPLIRGAAGSAVLLLGEGKQALLSGKCSKGPFPFLPPRKPHPPVCHNPPVSARNAMSALFFVSGRPVPLACLSTARPGGSPLHVQSCRGSVPLPCTAW